jgi:hypothetical protein
MRTKRGKDSKILRILPKRKAEGRPSGRGARRALEVNKLHAKEVSSNLRAARSIWGALPRLVLKNLTELTIKHHLSVPGGDVTMLGDKLYVTHAGLLRIGERNRCSGIVTLLQKDVSDPTAGRWVFKATVYRTADSRGFVGYGDADPSNTSPLVRGAEMRVAETRATNRALRKAFGIGICSFEELGSFSAPQKSLAATPHSNGHPGSNSSNNGQPRLRDQLCLLIRQHNLDPTLVKAYAADFCGTETLKEASRDLVESFITQIANSAKNDRDALVCKLNSYAQPVEANP